MSRHVVIFAVIAIILAQCSSRSSVSIGLLEGGSILRPCPASPNCVSSQSTDEKHRTAPISYTGSLADAKRALHTVVKRFSRSTIITETPVNIHAEFSSAFFGFIDDVEFLFDDVNKIVHCRSASRTGYSDLGVNRRSVN